MIRNSASFLTNLAVATATALLAGTIVFAQSIPAFPGAEGAGGHARGGRGGDVYHVTNLNSTGPGSFAEGIATVPAAGRTIVFDVSGWIHLPGGSQLRMTTSKVTIAGQTAPGDGIGFKDGTFRVSGDDVVVRYVRFRYRDQASGGDCLDLDSGSINSIFDHISVEFSTDENMSSFSSPPENMTFQWSLNAWGLESHSCGGLWDQAHATCHHTLWAHNHTRNPKARPLALDWVNNVTFDWDIGFIMGDSETPANWNANVRGNYFLCPPGNLRSVALEKARIDRNGGRNFSIYVDNNLFDKDGDGLLNGQNYGYGIASGSYTQLAAPVPNNGVPVTVDPPLLAYKKVLSGAGPLRLDVAYPGPLRDEVDTVLINNVVAQRRHHISNESQTGASNGGIGTLNSAAPPADSDKDGMPDYYETALGWNVATQDHNTALPNSGGVITGTTFLPANTAAGYTRLEEYLHFLAIPHGSVAKNVSGAPTSLQIDLRKFTSGFASSPVFTVANLVGGTVVQSGVGGHLATFTPTVNHVGHARFEFNVTDAAGSTWTQTFGIVVSANALPQNLVWIGDDATNAWDITSTTWLKGATTTTFSFGDNVLIDDRGSNAPALNLTTTLTPGSVTIDGAKNYTIAGPGALQGAMPLVKSGPATLTINNTGASTFSGGSTLNAGTITLANPTANVSGLGTGKITFLSGTLNMFSAGNATSAGVLPNPIEIVGTANLNVAPRCGLTGAVSGAGTLNYYTPYVRADLGGDWSGFSGTVNVTSDADGGDFRINTNATSFAQTRVNLGERVWMYFSATTPSTGLTMPIGALTGTATSNLRGGGVAGRTTTYQIGGLNLDSTFAGAIGETVAGATVNITKVGSGVLTLSSTNTYTGATVVNSGGLLVNGSLGNTPVTVANGAFLGGNGTIAGSVIANSGATLSPGSLTFTPATINLGNAGLSLNGNTLQYDLSSSTIGVNDRIAMNGGTLSFTGSQHFEFRLLDGTLGAGTYDLIAGAAAISGTPVFTHNLPSGSRQTFAIGMVGTTVRLTVTGTPATLTWSGTNSANWDTTSVNNWTGATPATFFNNDAVIFNDTTAVNTVTIPIALSPRSIVVNNNTRSYIIGGADQTSAAITGSGSLTKSGTGTLTLTGVNSFTGGTTINAGSTILFANDNANAGALGTGTITLNGGTLSMHESSASFTTSTLNLNVPSGQTGTLNADSRVDIYGALTGGGTLNFRVPFVRTTLFSDWSAFSGTINVTTDVDGGDFRMGTSYFFPGFPQATVNLAERVWAYYTGVVASGEGTTIEIGELRGGALSGLMGGSVAGRNFTYRIGGKTPIGSEVVFGGTIQEQNTGTTTSIVKTGAGTWTLSGICNWNGGTAVEDGILKIIGSVSSGAAINVSADGTLALAGGTVTTDAINVAANASLTGNGTIQGDLNNSGTITCGSSALTITGDVVNNGVMRFTGSAALSATGSFVNNGVLDLLTGAEALPPNLVNNGIVIANADRRVLTMTKSGANFTCTVQGYAGHVFQLQRGDSLTGPWTNVGPVQAGTGTVLTFTDTGGASTPHRFFRVSVSP